MFLQIALLVSSLTSFLGGFHVSSDVSPEVSIVFKHGDEPMQADVEYSVVCDVKGFPAGGLTIKLYKGDTVQEKQRITALSKMDSELLFDFRITPQIEDDGADYWCALELDLGPGEPEPPPLAVSKKAIASVQDVDSSQPGLQPATTHLIFLFLMSLFCALF